MTAARSIPIPATIDVAASDEILGLDGRSAALVLSLDQDGTASLDAVDDHPGPGRSRTFGIRHPSHMLRWHAVLPEGTPALADLDKMQSLAKGFLPLLRRINGGLAMDGCGREAGNDDAREASDAIARMMHDADWTRDVDICHVSEWTEAGERTLLPVATQARAGCNQ